jgi:hypothetical protein
LWAAAVASVVTGLPPPTGLVREVLERQGAVKAKDGLARRKKKRLR